MDIITHINVGILATNYCFGEKYLVLAVIFSAVPDLDHIIGVHRIIRERKVRVEYRIFHEPLFISLYILIGTVGMILFKNFKDVITVSLYNLVLHYSIDFLTGKCRPLYPFSKKEISSPIHERLHLKIFINVVTFIITTVTLLANGTYLKISNEILAIFKKV